MEKITRVFSFVNSAGKTKVCINNKIFLSPAQITNATGISGQFGILEGSEIGVVYYAKGEDMVGNSMKCTDDNKIVKEFTITLEPSLLAYKRAAAFGTAVQVAA